MLSLPQSMQKLIRELSKLPSIGERSATRLAYFLVHNDKKLSIGLAEALLKASENIRQCRECYFFTEREVCTVCEDQSRDRTLLCVVEKPVDLIAMERTGEYRGLYHVLHGSLSPIRGIGPEELKIKNLLERMRSGDVEEIILATNPTTEGEATANYLSRLLKPLGVKVTRIAMGLPVGSDLEYVDEVTMHKALTNRHEI